MHSYKSRPMLALYVSYFKDLALQVKHFLFLFFELPYTYLSFALDK